MNDVKLLRDSRDQSSLPVVNGPFGHDVSNAILLSSTPDDTIAANNISCSDTVNSKDDDCTQ